MLLSIIEQEAKSGLPGSNTLVRKLTEIIFVQALRIHMYKSNKNAGFFKLIENPQLSKTLEAIHHSLDKNGVLTISPGLRGCRVRTTASNLRSCQA